MDAVLNYLSMDGYAVYVWPAMAIAASVMIGMAVWSVVGFRATRRRLDELQPAVERRRAARRARTADASAPDDGGRKATRPAT